MNSYDPSKQIDPEAWQELDESLRIDLVNKYHQSENIELQEGSEDMHALVHVVIENQLAMGIPPVVETVAKLTRQGLSRHESIHAVGAVLSEDLFEMLSNNQHHDMNKYRRRLEELTAKRWKKGKW